MKKVVFIAPVLFALNGFAQNLIQTNISNTNMQQQRFVQPVQVFASNMIVNDNNTNKPARANANPQVYVQRATGANTIQRQQRRRRVNANPVNTNVSNPVQTNLINISNINDNIQPLINVLENNINNDIQLQGNFSQQADINDGNSFGNENNMIEQIASVNIPAILLGNGSLNLNLDITC